MCIKSTHRSRVSLNWDKEVFHVPPSVTEQKMVGTLTWRKYTLFTTDYNMSQTNRLICLRFCAWLYCHYAVVNTFVIYHQVSLEIFGGHFTLAKSWNVYFFFATNYNLVPNQYTSQLQYLFFFTDS